MNIFILLFIIDTKREMSFFKQKFEFEFVPKNNRNTPFLICTKSQLNS